MQQLWQNHSQRLRRFLQTWGVYCWPVLSKSKKWRIRKYHSLDAKGNLRGRNVLWFFVFVRSSIHLSNQLSKTCNHFAIIHPSIHHPSTHSTIQPSLHPSNPCNLHQTILFSIYLSLSIYPPINLPIIHPSIQSMPSFSIHPAINHSSSHPTAQLFSSPTVLDSTSMTEDLPVWLGVNQTR